MRPTRHNHWIASWLVTLLVSHALPSPAAEGLAARYPGDAGINNNPAVLFADDFESGRMAKWDQVRGGTVVTEEQPKGGHWCVRMTMERGKKYRRRCY